VQVQIGRWVRVKVQQKSLGVWVWLTLFACLGFPATATALFSDLGTGNNVYNDTSEFDLAGSSSIYGAINNSNSSMFADQFTVSGTGSLPVLEIDLAVSNILGGNSFFASIWTDNSGTPGTQVPDAFWDLSTTNTAETCCSLVTITGITGVTLTGGDEYFLVLGPQSDTDGSWNGWNYNSMGATGLSLQSTNGGLSWNTYYANGPLAAFDIVSPEPGSWLMIGLGLAAIVSGARYRRRAHRQPA
jgi:hypothetical protein